MVKDMVLALVDAKTAKDAIREAKRIAHIDRGYVVTKAKLAKRRKGGRYENGKIKPSLNTYRIYGHLSRYNKPSKKGFG